MFRSYLVPAEAVSRLYTDAWDVAGKYNRGRCGHTSWRGWRPVRFRMLPFVQEIFGLEDQGL